MPVLLFSITVVLASVPVLLLYWLVFGITVVLASVPVLLLLLVCLYWLVCRLLLLYWLVCRYYCCTGANITVVLASVSVLLLYWHLCRRVCVLSDPPQCANITVVLASVYWPVYYCLLLYCC